MNDDEPVEQTPVEEPADTPPPTPPPPADEPAPPPAARIVVEGTRTEREIALEEELQRERQAREEALALIKAREVEIAAVQDENHRLKNPQPVPAPRRRGPLGIRTADE